MNNSYQHLDFRIHLYLNNKKTSINIETIKRNCNHELIEQYYKDMTPTKFIQHIIT